METKGVNFINLQIYSARRYIEMYESLVDSVNNIGFPLKFTVFVLN